MIEYLRDEFPDVDIRAGVYKNDDPDRFGDLRDSPAGNDGYLTAGNDDSLML